jgi:hypothetical protein
MSINLRGLLGLLVDLLPQNHDGDEDRTAQDEARHERSGLNANFIMVVVRMLLRRKSCGALGVNRRYRRPSRFAPAESVPGIGGDHELRLRLPILFTLPKLDLRHTEIFGHNSERCVGKVRG